MFQQDPNTPAPQLGDPNGGGDPGPDQGGGLSPDAIAILGPDVIAALSDPDTAMAIRDDLRQMLGLGDDNEDNEQGSADGFDQDSMVDANGQTPGGPVQSPTTPMPPMRFGNTPGGPQGGPGAMLSPGVPPQPSGLRAAGRGNFGGR